MYTNNKHAFYLRGKAVKIPTRWELARQALSKADLPFSIKTHRAGKNHGYYLEQHVPADHSIKDEQVQSAIPEIDLSVSRETESDFTTHELSRLAWSLLGDKRIMEKFLETKVPFFPSKKMLEDIITRNGLPTNNLKEDVISALERVEDILLELKHDDTFYTHPESTDTWTLLFGLAMINRITFENNQGKRISGLAYISDFYKDQENTNLFEPITSDLWVEPKIKRTNKQLSEYL